MMGCPRPRPSGADLRGVGGCMDRSGGWRGAVGTKGPVSSSSSLMFGIWDSGWPNPWRDLRAGTPGSAFANEETGLDERARTMYGLTTEHQYSF
jgi:hypothetical protein